MQYAVKRLAHVSDKTAMAGKYAVLGIAMAQPVHEHLERSVTQQLLVHLLSKLLQLFLQDVFQLPVSIQLCNAKEEVLERFHASVCVLHFWVVLEAVVPPCLVFYGHNHPLHKCKVVKQVADSGNKRAGQSTGGLSMVR